MTGFISFKVVGEGENAGIVPVTQRGIVTGINRSSQGVFPITIVEQETDEFQVGVSNDESPFAFSIADRSITGFTLHIRKITGAPFDPSARCTVSIELPPPTE